jgi:nucleotide-binding universal stress UspA family protein
MQKKQGVETIRAIVETGEPREWISSLIPQQEAIDLIVMGATGKGAMQQAHLLVRPRLTSSTMRLALC